nr:hypothetical protein [uncultured Rhodoferax sp.]
METRNLNTSNHSPFARLVGAFLVATLLFLSACASGPRLVNHQFTFDGRNDGWITKVDLLEYSYGDKYREVRDSLEHRDDSLYKGRNSLPPLTGVRGPMPIGEFMYVKWRIKATGEVLEDRVDLRARLPHDMRDHSLTMVIDDRQLYLYVVTTQAKKTKEETPVLKTWLSNYYLTYQIYPSLTKR